MLAEPVRKAVVNSVESVIPSIRDVLQYWRTILRSGVIGVYIGILPGVGEDMASWSSYAAARRAAKDKEQFGKWLGRRPDGRRDRRQRRDSGGIIRRWRWASPARRLPRC